MRMADEQNKDRFQLTAPDIYFLVYPITLFVFRKVHHVHSENESQFFFSIISKISESKIISSRIW